MKLRVNTAGRLLLPVLMLLLIILVSWSPGQAQPPAQTETTDPDSCPGGERMAVQATGVYRSEPVEGAMINGKPWGGAYWDAGMRSYWHCHRSGQMMMVWEGEGRVQKRGEKMRTLQVGDTEYAGAWVEHWHGAVPDSVAHYLQVSFQPGGTFWMEEVGRDDYRGNDIGITSRNEFLETRVREKQPENR